MSTFTCAVVHTAKLLFEGIDTLHVLPTGFATVCRREMEAEASLQVSLVKRLAMPSGRKTNVSSHGSFPLLD